MVQWIRNPSAVEEIQVQSLGREDPQRRARQPTPVFLPGESRGQRRGLAGCSPWGRKESDTTQVTKHACTGRLNNRNLSSSGPAVWSLRSGSWLVWFLVRTLPLACRLAPSHNFPSEGLKGGLESLLWSNAMGWLL